MAVQRQSSLQGQQRVDVPQLRAIESGVAADFDVLGIVMSGKTPVVASGFAIASAGAVGNEAEKLVMSVAGASLIHFEATEAGSVFRVPENRADEVLGPTNPRIDGAFTPNSTNFVGIDIIRAADDSTADTLMFYNPSTDSESPVVTPLARTADYRIVVSTTEFSATPGLAPIAVVKTDSQNKVVTLSDARNLMFRLGAGGSSPSSITSYSWPGGRTETGTLATVGGDRSIPDLKSWMNAVMSRIWEGNGGEYWYSLTEYRNVRMFGFGSRFTSTGEYFEVVNASGTYHLHWKGIRIVFDNSTAVINEVSNQLSNSVGLTDLADGECLYVDLDRTQDRKVSLSNALVAVKAPLATLGGSARPGQRYVLAWRTGTGADSFWVRDQPFAVGGSFKLATTAAYGTVRITSDPVTYSSDSPVVPTVATSFAGRNTATAGGLSHNLDLAPSSLLGADDIVIGRGLSAGDQNVELLTSGVQYQTRVQGSGEWDSQGTAAFVVSHLVGGSINPTVRGKNRIQAWKGFPTVGSSARWVGSVETDGAVGLGMVTTAPATPEPLGTDAVRAKQFVRPSKFWKTDVRLATTGNLPGFTVSGSGVGKTLTATSNGALSIDSTATVNGDRVLVKNQTVNHTNHGIYVVTDTGSAGTPYILTRATDADQDVEVVNGMACHVTDGTINANTEWVLTTQDRIAIDKIPQTWASTTLQGLLVRKDDADAATVGALPAYTATGAGPTKTLTATANGALTVDGVSVAVDDRVLVKNETNAVNNGIYVVVDPGSGGSPYVLKRDNDGDNDGDLFKHCGLKVIAGTANTDTYWKLTNENSIVVDTTDLEFSITTLDTTDQLCIRWFDGSYEVVSQSPVYRPVR